MSSYRGPDRRGTVGADDTPSWWLAVAVAALAAAALMDVAGAVPVAAASGRGAAAGLALAAAAVSALRWWGLGDAASLWLTAGLLPAAGSLLAPDLLGDAGHLVGAASALAAAAVPEVDARQRRWWLAVLPLLGAALLAGVVDVPGAFAAAGWVLASAALAVRGVRRGRTMLVWLAAGSAGLALAVLTAGAATPMAAAAMALLGLLRGMRGAIVLQRERLLDAAVDARHAQARTEAAAYARERTSHDVLNTLTALGGAAFTLERHGDRLDEQTREELNNGFRRELDRMHALIAHDDADRPAPFSVVSALRPLQTEANAPGEWDIPEDLTAYGRIGDTGQVLRLLLATKREGAVVVRAGRHHDRVHIEVSGVRLGGLNHQVAEALMAAQGGALRPGSGAGAPGYVLDLPAAPA